MDQNSDMARPAPELQALINMDKKVRVYCIWPNTVGINDRDVFSA